MELKDIVCSLEQAQKLKQLGLNQTSFHHWIIGDTSVEKGWMITRVACYAPPPEDWQPCFSAYTLSELGRILPPFFASFVADGYKHAICRNERVDTFPLVNGETEYDNTPAYILNKELIPIQSGRTEAEAKGNMAIYLIENGLVDVCEINKRILKF